MPAANGAGRRTRAMAIATAALTMTIIASDTSRAQLYTRTGTDATWQQLLDANAIPIGTTSSAGVTGSLINVNNGAVETGPNGGNPIISNLRIHTLGNSSVLRGSFSKWSRWYQEDGTTQVFRLFKGEYNVQNDRPNAARIESFNPDVAWGAGDGWFQWQGTYTLISPVGGSIFQSKNSDNDWAVMLNTNGNGDLTLNHRTGTDQLLATNMTGRPFDLTVFDNGTNYIVYMDDQYAGQGSFSRPSGSSVFRWGMYVGDSIPAKDAMLFVTGARITPQATAPPTLSASLGTLPTRVIRGAVVSGTVSVSNVTPVTSATGAARLDYGYTASGLFTGSGTGSDMPLGGATTHAMPLKTDVAGMISGTVRATATSPLTAMPTSIQTGSMSVLDHGIGSFASASTLTSLEIDFGTLIQATGSASRSFSVFNRAGSLGAAWTAKLDLDGVTTTAPSVFSTTLSPFTSLSSGSSRTYSLSMLTRTTGSFAGTYSLNLSDEDLPGAAPQTLSLTVRGLVVSPSNAVLDVASGTQSQLTLGFAGITGTSSVTKSGGGTAVLNQINTYTGTTSILQGVLMVTSSASMSSSSLVNLAAGGSLDVRGILGGYSVPGGQTLGGSGTVLGSLTFGRDSTLAPGAPGASPFAGMQAAGVGAGTPETIAVPEPASVGLIVVGLGVLVITPARRGIRGPGRRLWWS